METEKLKEVKLTKKNSPSREERKANAKIIRKMFLEYKLLYTICIINENNELFIGLARLDTSKGSHDRKLANEIAFGRADERPCLIVSYKDSEVKNYHSINNFIRKVINEKFKTKDDFEKFYNERLAQKITLSKVIRLQHRKQNLIREVNYLKLKLKEHEFNKILLEVKLTEVPELY